MCGISAIISTTTIPIANALVKSLENLENRGYDSSGILISNDDASINIFKKVFFQNMKPLRLLKQEAFSNGTIGIGHNRWATHGGKSIINAHPHSSMNQSIFIVHNGIIENFLSLKEVMMEENIEFYTETDTEIVANLLYLNQKKNPEMSFETVIEKTIKDIIGTFALVIFNKDTPTCLYCVRRGSPLLVSHSKDVVMIASEQSGFQKNMTEYIILENEDICKIERIANKIHTFTSRTYEHRKISSSFLETSPHPFQHWTLKEIHEQPNTIRNAINHGGRIRDGVRLGGLDKHRSILSEVKHLVLLGCGTSMHACKCAVHFFKTWSAFHTVSAYEGADFDIYDIPRDGCTAVVLVSQSGETSDLYKGLQVAKSRDIFTIGVINVVDSLIAREVDCGVYCNAGREIGVASTKAFVSQCVCLFLCALWFRTVHGLPVSEQVLYDLHLLPSQFETAIYSIDLVSIIQTLNQYDHIFLLGKKLDEYIAMEGSLKIKEISYLHSEAYSMTSLKHGPFALLCETMPVILIHTDRKYDKKFFNCYQEIRSRNAPIYVITPFDDIDIPDKICIPYNRNFSFLLALIPLQLLAYSMAVERGFNPDNPRNLAKVVTVE